MAFSPRDYDVLERAVVGRSRIALTRHGRQWIVVAERLRVAEGREVLEARHPSTGETLAFLVDDLEAIEVV
jgi:hypothetical protein